MIGVVVLVIILLKICFRILVFIILWVYVRDIIVKVSIEAWLGFYVFFDLFKSLKFKWMYYVLIDVKI